MRCFTKSIIYKYWTGDEREKKKCPKTDRWREWGGWKSLWYLLNYQIRSSIPIQRTARLCETSFKQNIRIHIYGHLFFERGGHKQRRFCTVSHVDIRFWIEIERNFNWKIICKAYGPFGVSLLQQIQNKSFYTTDEMVLTTASNQLQNRRQNENRFVHLTVYLKCIKARATQTARMMRWVWWWKAEKFRRCPHWKNKHIHTRDGKNHQNKHTFMLLAPYETH